MKNFFKFFSVAFIIMTWTALIIATNVGIRMQSDFTIAGFFIINVMCGMYLGYVYQKNTSK